jgi:pimeloyl-ACP methyl ester carboxylesterase
VAQAAAGRGVSAEALPKLILPGPRGRAPLAALAASALLACPAARPAPPADVLTVGSLQLHACGKSGAYCATLPRPLDPSGRVAGDVPVYFEYYPHRGAGPSAGTLVAVEGGPGYPSTDTRAAYLALFEPLRDRRDVLLTDARGTGRSGAIRCEPLQDAPRITTADVGACGRSLGVRAPLFSTAFAADDLAAILVALGAGPVDLYGDSYGTFFAQVFARRHGQAVRSLTLDSAYPLAAPDEAWVPSYASAMRRKFDLACERSPACRSVPGTSLEHIAPALAELRRHPAPAEARDADGHPQHFSADAAALATVMFGSSPNDATVRELDAAARAFAAGDRPPLLRLMAESLTATDSRDASHDPRRFSLGQSVTVMCQDAQQIYDMTFAPPARRAQRDQRVLERERAQPDLYAPFTFAEYRRLPLDYSFLDECIEWPAPPPEHPPQLLHPADSPPPTAPVLVLIGELDNITTPENGRAVAAIYPSSHAVTLRNSFHVNARPGSRSDCAMQLVRRFIASLDPGDTSCADDIAPLHLVPAFARELAGLAPATALAGNEADERALRAAHAAVRTLADVLGRMESNTSGHGPGLRGGAFRTLQAASGTRIALDRVRFSEDLLVSGSLLSGGVDGTSWAELKLDGAPDVRGHVRVRWNDAGEVRARIDGVIGGRNVCADALAP